MSKSGIAQVDIQEFESLNPGDFWVGESPAMNDLRQMILRKQGLTLPLLISGEPGTGKSLLAKLFHQYSKMSDLPLYELEHKSIHVDYLQELGEGTFFIDHIEKLSQLEQNELYLFLSSVHLNKRIRFILSSDYQYEDLQQYKMLRPALLEKLAVLKVYIPPVRERAQDIPAYVKHYMKQDEGVFPVMHLLKNYPYDWPGNINELFSIIDVLREKSAEHGYQIDKMEHFLPKKLEKEKNFHQNLEYHIREHFKAHEGKMMPCGLYQRIIQEVEKVLIKQTLEVTGGNQIKASRILGLHRNTLRKKIAELF